MIYSKILIMQTQKLSIGSNVDIYFIFIIWNTLLKIYSHLLSITIMCHVQYLL